MDPDERQILSIISNTNKTLFDAQKKNRHRVESINFNIQESRMEQLVDISIKSMDAPLAELRDEIYKRLRFSREYVDILEKHKVVNLYDAAEIIVEVDDILRFKNFKHFLSYAGLAPIVKKGKNFYKIQDKNYTGTIVANKKQYPINYCENLKKVLNRCANKLIKHDYTYKQYYHQMHYHYKKEHPDYNQERIERMAKKKVTIKFAKYIYNEFKKIALYEKEEAKQYGGK